MIQPGAKEKNMYIRSVAIRWDEIGPDSWLRGIPALAGLGTLRLTKPVTFWAGENGSGKSTLLEAVAIACGFNPEGGTFNYGFSTRDSHSKLHEAIRIVRDRKPKWGYFLRAESFYNVATMEEEYAKGPFGSPNPLHLHERSHGESFLTVVQEQMREGGLYLLDEPEAALSPQRQLTLLIEMDRCVRDGAQFIIATHSPILLAMPGAEILHFGEDGVTPIAFEDTESCRITSMIINDRQRLFRQLFTE